ncbi:MAG: YncE family protein [Vicinamibacterales bacterium]
MRTAAACTAVVLMLGPAADAQDGPYRFVREISIATEGGWDYLSVDPPAHRLYVTHATSVVVIDTQTNKVVGEIADTPGVHGFAIAADLGRGFASNGRENMVSIVDLKTLKTVQKVATGENPDAVYYEPGRHEVYAFNGRGKSATVIDAAGGKVVATIPLDGKPEFAQGDAAAGKVYVNIEDLHVIKAIDTATHAVTATWPIAPGESASGMAYDAANHRLFIGCENKLMLMIDSASGAVVYSVPIGDGVDANAYDPGTRLAFASSGGSGTVTVAREESPGVLRVVQTLKTARGARTMALDPSTHTIYLAATDYEPQAAGARERPKPVAGTFRVLVYQMK